MGNTNQTPAIIDERNIRDRIYSLRGQQVMPDFDLAEIDGYSTTAFNQQVSAGFIHGG